MGARKMSCIEVHEMLFKKELTSSHDEEWNQGLNIPKVASPNTFKMNKRKKIISFKNGLH
jgi:hypothetical protein